MQQLQPLKTLYSILYRETVWGFLLIHVMWKLIHFPITVKQGKLYPLSLLLSSGTGITLNKTTLVKVPHPKQG